MDIGKRPVIKKSRCLSGNQLFEILQEEYIVCELRAKIYPKEHINSEGKVVYLQAYWKDLMDKKRLKIIDIAKKNSLFSIFDDSRIKIDYEKRIIPEMGFPKFIYRDDTQRLICQKWDIHNYYSKKSKVKVYDDKLSKFVEGYIKSVDLNLSLIKILLDDESIREFDIDLVTRIL